MWPRPGIVPGSSTTTLRSSANAKERAEAIDLGGMGVDVLGTLMETPPSRHRHAPESLHVHGRADTRGPGCCQTGTNPRGRCDSEVMGATPIVTDAALVAAVADGDMGALRVLYERHGVW